MANYLVSSAGNNNYNGEYIDRDTVVNGKPSYKKDGANYYLYYAYEEMMMTYRWVLTSYVSATIMDAWMETAYFHTNTGQATPDAGAWSVGDETMSGGTSPAPTVTEAGTRISGTITIAIADPADYVVDGCGTAAFDGEYSEDGTFNGKPKYTNGDKCLFWGYAETPFVHYSWYFDDIAQNYSGDRLSSAYYQVQWSYDDEEGYLPLTSESAWGGGTGDYPAPTVTTAPTDEALASVVVTADDGASFEESDTTDANGDYSIDVDDGATYTVTPVLSGYSFTPAFRQVEIDGASEDNVDFEASEFDPPSYEKWTWGHESPDEDESPEAWIDWSDGAGGSPSISGSSSWGSLQLGVNDVAHSPVKDFNGIISGGDFVAFAKYGSIVGEFDFYYRESDTVFAQDDESPEWQLYTGETGDGDTALLGFSKRYRQIKLKGV